MTDVVVAAAAAVAVDAPAVAPIPESARPESPPPELVDGPMFDVLADMRQWCLRVIQLHLGRALVIQVVAEPGFGSTRIALEVAARAPCNPQVFVCGLTELVGERLVGMLREIAEPRTVESVSLSDEPHKRAVAIGIAPAPHRRILLMSALYSADGGSDLCDTSIFDECMPSFDNPVWRNAQTLLFVGTRQPLSTQQIRRVELLAAYYIDRTLARAVYRPFYIYVYTKTAYFVLSPSQVADSMARAALDDSPATPVAVVR